MPSESGCAKHTVSRRRVKRLVWMRKIMITGLHCIMQFRMAVWSLVVIILLINTSRLTLLIDNQQDTLEWDGVGGGRVVGKDRHLP